MRYPVSFENNGQLLIGVVHRPTEDANERPKRPGVVMLHGFTGNKVGPHRMFVKMAERLSTLGIVSLRVDFRGSGDSEGNFEDASFQGEVDDALRACNYMIEQEDVDPQRLGMLGLSLGGAVAACASGHFPEIRSTALWAALADNTLPLFHVIANELKQHTYYDHAGHLIGPAFMEVLSGYVPCEDIVRHRQPVLIVHGTNDETVPVDHAHKYEAALREESIQHTMHIIEGADHTFNSHSWESEVLDVTEAWFAKTLLK